MILTTSPTVSNPSTALLERVVDTFKLVPSLLSCHLIIVCDGIKEIPDEIFD